MDNPVAALCHGAPAALDLQVMSLHMLQQFIDEVDVGVGHLTVLVLGPSGSWVDQSASFHSLTPTSRASSPALSQVDSILQKAARSWVSSAFSP